MVVLILNVFFAAVSSRPVLWVLPLLSLPSIIDGIRLWRTEIDTVLPPLVIDITGIGLLITAVGLSPVAVAYGLLMVVASGVLAPAQALRRLYPYVAGWMATALVISSLLETADRWDPRLAMAYSIAHSLVATIAIGMLIALVMRHVANTERQRSRLVGGFTHEMRNALTGAVGIAELLNDHYDELDRDEVLTYAALVVSEGREAVAMTEDLLVAARAEAKRLEVASEEVDLAVEAHRVISTFVDPSGTSDVETNWPSPAPTCLGDPVRIRQIIRNLLSNARRYGGDDVRVSISAGETMAILEVADSGEPIPAAERERIFDAYQRAQHRRHHAESVGLGLTISRHLARLMGGDLIYRHTDGWSVFELTIPIAHTPENTGPERIGEVLVAGEERVWLGVDGIIRTRVLPDAEIHLDDARASVTAYAHVAAGRRRPILVYAEDIAFLAPEARNHFTKSDEAATCLTAVALVVDASPTARTIVNHISRLTNPPFPTRLFEDETEAVAWLTEHMETDDETGFGSAA